MGTVVSLDVRGAGAADAQAAFARLMVWLHDVDRRFSTYRLDSEVNRIDRGELPVAAASDDVRWVLDRCVRLCAETEAGKGSEDVDDDRALPGRNAAHTAPHAEPAERCGARRDAHAGNPGVERTWPSARIVIAS